MVETKKEQSCSCICVGQIHCIEVDVMLGRDILRWW